MEVYLIASYIPVYQRDPYGISCKDNILRSYALHSRVHTEEVFSTGENIVLAAVNKKRKAGFGILAIGTKYRFHADWRKGRILGIKENRHWEKLNNCFESDDYWIYCQTDLAIRFVDKYTFKYVAFCPEKSCKLKKRISGGSHNYQNGLLVLNNTLYMITDSDRLVSIELCEPYLPKLEDRSWVEDICIYKDQVLVARSRGHVFSLGLPQVDFLLKIGPKDLVTHIGAFLDRILIVTRFSSSEQRTLNRLYLCKNGGKIMDKIENLSDSGDVIRNYKITSKKNMGIMWLNHCNHLMDVVLFNKNILMLIKNNTVMPKENKPENFALATASQTKAFVSNSLGELNLYSLHLSLK